VSESVIRVSELTRRFGTKFVGRTRHSIDASSVMWAFFREHPLASE
jgi:poly(3-hydroxybutyrate) depolymerase